MTPIERMNIARWLTSFIKYRTELLIENAIKKLESINMDDVDTIHLTFAINVSKLKYKRILNGEVERPETDLDITSFNPTGIQIKIDE